MTSFIGKVKARVLPGLTPPLTLRRPGSRYPAVKPGCEPASRTAGKGGKKRAVATSGELGSDGPDTGYCAGPIPDKARIRMGTFADLSPGPDRTKHGRYAPAPLRAGERCKGVGRPSRTLAGPSLAAASLGNGTGHGGQPGQQIGRQQRQRLPCPLRQAMPRPACAAARSPSRPGTSGAPRSKPSKGR